MGNKFECRKCGGSGTKENPKNGRGFTYKCLPCPACHEGDVSIGVRENETSRPHYPYYRPLTGDELEELEAQEGFSIGDILGFYYLSMAHRGVSSLMFKGQPVKLMPWRE